MAAWLDKLNEKKLFISLMIIIVASGILIRFSNYAAEGYDGDAQNVLAAGTYWFYPPYKYFPALIDQEPPLGNLIIGVGCMASGEDFSGVRGVTPLYFPDRAVLFGKAAVRAENYCFFPIYLFGAIFLILLAIMATIMLEKPAALFFTAFFSYCPLIIKWNRLIHNDSVLWVFVAAGLLFLWLGYSAEKNSKKERAGFILSFAFFGLAGATKLTAGLFFVFAPLLFIEKYKEQAKICLSKLSQRMSLELGKSMSERSIDWQALKTFVFSLIAMIIAFLAPFKFNPRNFIDMHKAFTTMNMPGSGGIHLTWNFFKGIYYAIINMNLIETIILLFAIVMLIRIIAKPKKDSLEKFLLALLFLQFVALTCFSELVLGAKGIFRAVPYMVGLPLLMSLAFSSKPYSLVTILKLRKRHVYGFMLIFVIYSFIMCYTAPLYQRPNEIVCIFSKATCEDFQTPPYAKMSADYLKSVIKETENFFHGDIDTTVYFYIRPENSITTWNMIDASMQTYGRRPTLNEYALYFNQTGKPLRYILLSKVSENADREEFKTKYAPNHVITWEGREIVYVYDLQNLQSR